MTRFTMALTLAASLVAATASAQVKLERKFEPGTYAIQEHVIVKQSLKLNGASIDTGADVVIHADLTYGEHKGDEPVPATIKFKEIKAKVTLPGNSQVEFDSTKPEQPSANPIAQIATAQLKKQVGLELKHTISADGKASEVTGIVEGSGLNADDLKADYQTELDRLPKTTLKKGDTWERTEEMHLGQGQYFTVKRKYEYQGSAPKVATVKDSPMVDTIKVTDLDLKYGIKPNQGLPVVVTKSDLKLIDSEGELIFDRSVGRVVESNHKMHVTGPLSLSANGQNIDGDLDLTLESHEKEIGK